MASTISSLVSFLVSSFVVISLSASVKVVLSRFSIAAQGFVDNVIPKVGEGLAFLLFFSKRLEFFRVFHFLFAFDDQERFVQYGSVDKESMVRFLHFDVEKTFGTGISSRVDVCFALQFFRNRLVHKSPSVKFVIKCSHSPKENPYSSCYGRNLQPSILKKQNFANFANNSKPRVATTLLAKVVMTEAIGCSANKRLQNRSFCQL